MAATLVTSDNLKKGIQGNVVNYSAKGSNSASSYDVGKANEALARAAQYNTPNNTVNKDLPPKVETPKVETPKNTQTPKKTASATPAPAETEATKAKKTYSYYRPSSSGYSEPEPEVYDDEPGPDYGSLLNAYITQRQNALSDAYNNSMGRLDNSYKSSINNIKQALDGTYGNAINNASNSIRDSYDRALSEAQNQINGSYNSAYENLVNNLNQAYGNSKGELESRYGLVEEKLAENLANARKLIDENYNYTSDQLNQAADKSLQEQYVQKMMADRNIGQQLRAMGINGGAAESTLANMANNYGTNRANIYSALQNNLAQALLARDTNQNNALTEYNKNYNDVQTNLANILANLETNRGNNLANSLSNLETNRGNQLANLISSLETGKGNQLASLTSNLTSSQASQLANALTSIETNRGNQLANMESNYGNAVQDILNGGFDAAINMIMNMPGADLSTLDLGSGSSNGSIVDAISKISQAKADMNGRTGPMTAEEMRNSGMNVIVPQIKALLGLGN